ncbi:CDP-diacylglycerol--glycerol-3-phosphate 3-phosphatidyltransferase [Sinomonas cellulolyticus]|uniref:CDP-alcohol phosphatidyltransferase family protein n=1 Tax=Sinomonas cellulolyticus TaxID=2801916 RepID=A0ABS1JYL0_9MICC|nr:MULTISPECIES: CDP-alcohol phosphatidyltransferase family protein [Sinomonas]MBL0704320.1 CDP-alcohol phosphatidyltransferase family protein [Sinomonas cellulolyticus]GHG47972.1 CDP-diacylglycerol--glycerol-3-phosphate 3-phosphatidyltransferase [Sinomonas sp. KCTC 49339]
MRFFNAGARAGQEYAETSAVVTLPNAITVLRFLGVPLFMWLVLAQREYGWGVVVLVVLGGTDWVDGYVARRLGQVSALGKVLDPAADRLALLAVALTLVLAGVVQWWYLAALLVPDLVLGTASLFYFRNHPDLPVSKIGKVRTALLLVGTPLLVVSKLAIPAAPVYAAIAWAFLILGLIGHWIAAANYFRAIVAKGRPVRESRREDIGRGGGR